MTKRLFLSFSLIILAATNVIGSADTNIFGQSYYISGCKTSHFYRYTNLTSPFVGKSCQVMIIGEIKAGNNKAQKDLYIAEFASGEEVYVDKKLFDQLINNASASPVGIRESLTEIKSGQFGSSAEDKFAEERSKILKELKAKGIAVGKTVWLKIDYEDLAALSMLKIKSIKLIDRYGDEGKSVEFSFDNDGFDKPIIFTGANGKEIAANFHTKDVTKTWSKKFLKMIDEGKVAIGMTKDQVLASWGKPNDINRTVGKWGVNEQWVYSNAYLYFENGVLRALQD